MRKDNVVYFFINGIKVYQMNYTDSLTNIGYFVGSSDSSHYIDELRISDRAEFSETGFTPWDTPYTNGGDDVYQINCTSQGVSPTTKTYMVTGTELTTDLDLSTYDTIMLSFIINYSDTSAFCMHVVYDTTYDTPIVSSLTALAFSWELLWLYNCL